MRYEYRPLVRVHVCEYLFQLIVSWEMRVDSESLLDGCLQSGSLRQQASSVLLCATVCAPFTGHLSLTTHMLSHAIKASRAESPRRAPNPKSQSSTCLPAAPQSPPPPIHQSSEADYTDRRDSSADCKRVRTSNSPSQPHPSCRGSAFLVILAPSRQSFCPSLLQLSGWLTALPSSHYSQQHRDRHSSLSTFSHCHKTD